MNHVDRSTGFRNPSRSVAAALGLLFLAGSFAAALASEKAPVARAKPGSYRSYTPEESKLLADKAQRVAEAQQRLWDRKMKAISGSICTGC